MIFKVVLRNLKKHPFLNLIKVIGLSLSLTGVLFILLFLRYEISYDAYHTRARNIYRYSVTDPDFLGGKHFARLYNPGYIQDLKNEIPEIENFVRLRPVRGGLMKYGERYYGLNQAFECDSTFFNVFDAELIYGDKQSVLATPGSLVITQKFAEKIFGNSDPIGQILTLPAGQYYGNAQDFTIRGIMKEFPNNSHFHPDFVATPVQDGFKYGWAWTYLVLGNNASEERVKSGITNYLIAHKNPDSEKMDSEVHLQKLTEIHLYSHKLREIEQNGNARYIYVLGIAAVILILIAISNYANLNIGMAGFNAKYLFVNKLLGSSKTSATKYFLSEGSIIILLTLLTAMLITIPANALILKFYGLNLLSGNKQLLFIVVMFFAFITLFFGLLPLIKTVFSSLNSLSDKRNFILGSKARINRMLIVLQYTFSIALIIAVIVISRQTNYAFKSSMGAEKGNVICMESVHASIQQKFEVFKEELLKYSSIESVSAMMDPPGGEANDMFPFEMEGYTVKNENAAYDRIGVFPCDYSFASLFNLEFLAGQNFTEDNKGVEGSGEYIINEAAVSRLNHASPADIIGKNFKLIFSMPGSNITMPAGRITGVVKNFHLSSLRKEVEPLVMFKREKMWLINFVVSFKPGMREQALLDMSYVWSSLFPEYPFRYEDVGVMYKNVYKAELLQARLLSIFTIIALFISSMGMFGLALIITQHKIKEIGIRKVNGARVSEILAHLNKDFMLWVIIAFVLAGPVAWFAMNKWLENFAYKTNLGWWIFLLAGLLALCIVLLTVSIQSWKAATRNPVDSLRYE